MKTILYQLYHGKICPFENNAPREPEYRENNRKIGEELEIIKKKLSPEDIARLDKIEGYQAEMSDMEAVCAFQAGLKLGLMLMYEMTGRH